MGEGVVMSLFTRYSKAKDFIDSINKVYLMNCSYEYLKIYCDYDLKDMEITQEDFTMVLHDHPKCKYAKLYYEGYDTGLYSYGLRAEQWWSSNCKSINKYLCTNITEVVVNNQCYGIDKELERYIKENLSIINKD